MMSNLNVVANVLFLCVTSKSIRTNVCRLACILTIIFFISSAFCTFHCYGFAINNFLLLFMLVMVILFFHSEADITLTPNQYSYKMVTEAPGFEYIRFYVQACNDAHVLLYKAENDLNNNLYEIVFGKTFCIN